MGIPLRRGRRVVGHTHAQAVAVAEAVLQVEFPGARGATVAAAPVGQDLQSFGLGIVLAALGAPPFLDAVDGERRGVGGLADEDGAGVGPGVVDAVGDGEAVGIGAEVVVVDQLGSAVPLGAGIAECADELLLLGVDADDRRVVGGAPLTQFGDVVELVVAVRVRGAGTLLVVDAQRESHLLEKPGDGPRADVGPELAQLGGDLGGGAACPLQATDRVAGRLVVHQVLDVGDDFRRFFSAGGRPPPTRRTRSISTSRSTSCRRPAATVDGSMPSSSAMRRSPPHPHLSASRPANSRRCRSSSRLANNTIAARSSLRHQVRPVAGARTSPGVAINRRRARSWWGLVRAVGRAVEELGRRACAASAARC